ncbi:L-type lectin-domain containing receptor kinase VII.1 [Linum perenne]
MNHLRLLITILFLLILSDQTSSVDFIFNRFNSTANSTTNLLLYGSATVESQILTLTNSTAFTIGRALFPQKIRTKPQNSSHIYPFSASFIFDMAPYRTPCQATDWSSYLSRSPESPTLPLLKT